MTQVDPIQIPNDKPKVSSFSYSINLNSFSGNAQNLRWSIEEQIDKYEWLVKLLSKYEKSKSMGTVHIDGFGRSGLAGDIWEDNLELIDIRTVQYLRERAPAWISGDSYGVLSGGGDKPANLRRMDASKEDGVTTWAMSSTPESPITKSKSCDKYIIVPGREEQVPEREQSMMAIAPMGSWTEENFSLNGIIIPLSIYDHLHSDKDLHEIIRERTMMATDYVGRVVHEMTKRENTKKVKPIIEEGVNKEMLLISTFGPGKPAVLMEVIRTVHAGFDGKEKSVSLIDSENYWEIKRKIDKYGSSVSEKVGAMLYVNDYFLDEDSPFNGLKLLDYLYSKNVDIYSISSVEDKRIKEKSKYSIVFPHQSEKVDENKEIDLSALGFMLIGDAIVCCWSPESEMRKRHRKAE